MAIVDSPLLSLGAKKSIGKTITFSRVKGQNIARQRVIPSNPRTAAQQAQRSLMSKAVGLWQTGGLTSDDVAAYNRWASAAFRTQSGYNRFASEVTKYLAKGVNEDILKAGAVSYNTTTSATLYVEAATGATVKGYIGTSKTAQPTEISLTEGASGVYEGASASTLVDGVQYYVYFRATLGSQVARSGLYDYLHTIP